MTSIKEIHLHPKFNFIELVTLLSLKNLPQNGYQIENNIINMTYGQFHLSKGTVYKTLGRLRREGYVYALVGGLYDNRHFYDLTQEGENRIRAEINLLRQLTSVYDHR
jgi:DNA-binding PadR family transcriptional regulator